MSNIRMYLVVLLCLTYTQLCAHQLDSLYQQMKKQTDLYVLENLLKDYQEQSEDLNAPDQLSRAYFLVAYRYQQNNNYNKALHYYTQSRLAAKSVEDIPRQQRAIENLADIAKKLQRYQQSENFFREALALNRRSGDKQQIAESLKDVGILLELGNKTTESLKFLHEAYDAFLVANDTLAASGILLDIGIVFKKLESYNKSRDYYFRAMHLSPTSNIIQAKALNNISEIAFRQGNNKEAIEKITQSIKIKKTLNNNYLLISSLNNLGTYHYYSGELDKAISVFTQSFKLNASDGKHGTRPTELHEAYAFLDSIKTIKKDMYLLANLGVDDIYRRINLNVLHDKMLLEKKEMRFQAELYDDQVLRRKIEKEYNQVIYLSIAGTLFALILVGFIIIRERKRKAAKLRLLRKMQSDLDLLQ